MMSASAWEMDFLTPCSTMTHSSVMQCKASVRIQGLADPTLLAVTLQVAMHYNKYRHFSCQRS
jgi:hypothetical protein